MSSRKRARTAAASRAPKRPISKELVAISKTGTAATQATTTLYTATFPVTVVGMRWALSFIQDAGTGACNVWWAIVVVRDGITVSTVAISDAAAFFEPEQDVLAFGNALIDNNTTPPRDMGASKTMRKLQTGDRLVFIDRGVATDTHATTGIVQFFVKA
nr:hypothetical protein [Cressdnaviricota sp.]